MKYRTKAIGTNGLFFNQYAQFDAEIVSLGAGTQSTVMALLADRNHFGVKPDFAVFADTGWEPKSVMKHLWWLAQQLSYPVFIANNGNIKSDIEQKMTTDEGRFASIPYFTSEGGMGRRQCTSEYKIVPVRREVRRQLGYKPRQRVKHSVRQWIGISTDEIIRMKDSQDKWCTHAWPLVEFNFSRDDCIQWFEEEYPARPLPKSACKGCPFTNDERWLWMQENTPDEFEEACEIDEKIREGGPLRGMKEQQFTHRSLIPLREVNFTDKNATTEWGWQMECEGICGV